MQCVSGWYLCDHVNIHTPGLMCEYAEWDWQRLGGQSREPVETAYRLVLTGLLPLHMNHHTRHNKTFVFMKAVLKFVIVTSHERHGVSNQWQHDCLFSSSSKAYTASHYLPFEWGTDGDMKIPHKGSVMWKTFPYVMMSLCIWLSFGYFVRSVLFYMRPVLAFGYCRCLCQSHDDVIKRNHFPRYWPFVQGIHRSRWIPCTKVSDAELWCFLWSVSE